MSFDLV